ncbi:hypothetical protein V6N12_051432 [Hibiscus sabdariffa]|uniref:DUF4378 domain-containing protein n=1 Tax=Hibiscus sabdariffa TaxID=183260 RepID=A0ABR2GFA2_9ROSI
MAKGNIVLQEVWRKVGRNLAFQLEHDESLDDIVGRDLEKDAWMMLHGEAEFVALELEELVFSLKVIVCNGETLEQRESGSTMVVVAAQTKAIVHFELRKWLNENVGADIASSTRITYGGSVNGANCQGFAGQRDVDDFLVGEISQKFETWILMLDFRCITVLV